MDKWTQEDERALELLKRRKDAVEATRKAPLLRLATRVFVQPANASVLAAAMIRCAGELRDALEPFDSGARNRASA